MGSRILVSGGGSSPGQIGQFVALPEGWLKANGAAVSRTDYADLFAAIGTTFGAGDGSTTFNLPDLRGEFLRGADDGRGVDTNRAIGSAQSDQNRAHSHTLTFYNGYNEYGGVLGPRVVSNSASALSRGTSTHGGGEARPRNVAFLMCIKY